MRGRSETDPFTFGARMSVGQAWNRIAQWHEQHCPAGVFQLNPGASQSDIAEVEAVTGQTFPEDVRESFRRHNGGATDTTWLLWYGELLDLNDVIEQWKMYRQMQETQGYGVGEDWRPHALIGPAKPIWWNTSRIHLTDNSGEHLTIDLDPPDDGHLGQIIYHDHEIGPTEVLAASWLELLEQIANDLEAGKYVYDDEEMTVAPPGMFS